VGSQALVTALQGNLHLVGEVGNAAGQTVTDVVLTLVAQDAAGVSLFKTESGDQLPEVSFAPLVATLADGQTAPFDYAFPAGIPNPASYQVFVSAYTPSTDRLLSLQVEHTQVMTGPGGEAVLVGELVNQNPVAVSITAAAAILRDAAGVPLSAGKASVLPGMLQPAGDSLNQDRAPFKIPFFSALTDGATWQVAVDAGQSEPVDTSLFAIDQAVNVYVDSSGGVHLVSSLRNNAERSFTMKLLAAVYSTSGDVLDAASLTLPVDLAPGSELPFDAADFPLLAGRADQQGKLDHYTLQVDGARTLPSLLTWEKLAAVGSQAVQGEQGVWKFEGSVTNTTSVELRKIVVLAMLKNHTTGALVAVSSADLVNPAGSIAPGVHMEYSIEVLTDPASQDVLNPEVLVFGAGG
jgi:hypothetical protein